MGASELASDVARPLGEPMAWRRKFAVPDLPDAHVPRPRLTSRISAAVEEQIVVLAAGDGFGKTTLAAEWARGTDLDVGWVSLDRADNSPTALLVAALRSVRARRPGFGEQALVAATGPPERLAMVGLPMAVAACEELDPPIVIVIDDLDRVTDQVALDGLRRVLRYLPPQLRMIVTTRDDGSLPLERLRLDGRIVELREDDLRFTEAETGAVAEPALDATAGSMSAERLHAETGGWPAGVVLTAPVAASDAHALDLRRLPVRTLLRRAILSWIPDDLATFFLQVGQLEAVSPGLARTVTGRDDAGALLESLHRRHILDAPRRDAGQPDGPWWTIAPVVSGFAREEARLLGMDVDGVLTAATTWHAARRDLQPAMTYALCLDDRGAAAADVLSAMYFRGLAEGLDEQVEIWVRQLRDLRPEDDRLLLASAMTAMHQGRDAQAAAELAELDLQLRHGGGTVGREQTMLRIQIARRAGRFQDALDMAEGLHREVAEDPSADPGVLGRARLSLGMSRLLADHVADSLEPLMDVTTDDLSPTHRSIAHSYLALAAWLDDDQPRMLERTRAAARLDPITGTPNMVRFVTASLIAMTDPSIDGADALSLAETVCAASPEPGQEVLVRCARVVRLGEGWPTHDAARPGGIAGSDPVALLSGARTAAGSTPQPSVLPRLIERAARITGVGAVDASYGTALSDTEIRILGMLGGTVTEREIAAELHLSHNTVRTYRRRLYKKLGVSSRAEAVRAAKRLP